MGGSGRGTGDDIMSKKRIIRIAVVSTAMMTGWFIAFGPPPSWILAAQDKANYQRLLHAPYFASRAVGFLAVEPPEASAFVALASHRGGGTALKYALLRGTPAARIYALVGLRRTDPAFFWIAGQPFRVLPGTVTTFFGCVLSAEPIRTVVATDKDNPVRLRNGETLRHWWQRRPQGAPADLDVIGGGYTAMFFEWDELVRPRPNSL